MRTNRSLDQVPDLGNIHLPKALIKQNDASSNHILVMIYYIMTFEHSAVNVEIHFFFLDIAIISF